jgi:hypothetical protein
MGYIRETWLAFLFYGDRGGEWRAITSLKIYERFRGMLIVS